MNILTTEQLDNLANLVQVYEALKDKTSVSVGYTLTTSDIPVDEEKDFITGIREQILVRINDIIAVDCDCEEEYEDGTENTSACEDCLDTEEIKEMLKLNPGIKAKHQAWDIGEYMYYDKMLQGFYLEDKSDFSEELDEMYNNGDMWEIVND